MAAGRVKSRGSANRAVVVGMGMSPEDLSLRALSIIRDADILIGGNRHLSYFPEVSAAKIPVHKNFSRVVQVIRTSLKQKKKVAVIASGDPGYFGIAGYLIEQLGKEAIEIIPNVTTFQAAFARIKENWDDALLLSFHGRPLPHLASLLREHSKVGILTDHRNTPAAIARRVMTEDPALKATTAYVTVQLGTREERVYKYLLKNLVNKSFPPLNAMLLFPPRHHGNDNCLHLGIPDRSFAHQEGLITKDAVRVFTLARLNLPLTGVLWDIGSGSGSIAIEAALLAPDLAVYAVEKNEKRLKQIRRNCEKFNTAGTVVPVLGDAPTPLKSLPMPHRVFIGGTGGKLLPVLRYCRRALLPSGKIVINAVTLETVNAAVSFFEKAGFTHAVTLLNISRLKKIGRQRGFQPLTPVFVIEGTRKA